MADSAKARLRYSKTSCYLCSEWLDDDEIDDHLIQCSRKSIACPDGCGTVLPRKHMQAHWRRCVKAFGDSDRTSTLEDVDNHVDGSVAEMAPSPTIYDQVQMLGHELHTVRLAVGEEVNQRAELMAQLQQLKRRAELADKWTVKVNAALMSFNKLVSHESNRRSVDVSGLEQRQNQLELWRLDLTTRFNSIESKSYSSAESEPSYSVSDEVCALQQQLDRVEHELVRLQAPERLANAHLLAEQESAKMAASKQEQVLSESQTETNRTADLEHIKGVVAEVVEKNAKTACRLQEALQQTFECEERVLQMAKQLERYRRETYYTKQRLDALQANLKLEEKLAALSSTDGRVIWRIDDFEKRFLESKDNDTMLKGPIFTNQPYGYVLQLEASLYGIGTWRGRNLIAGLTILKGSYDALLQWPCMLTGTIRLRDQPEERSGAMDICKSIIAKRKDQKMDKHQFIYVPHDVLRSRHFIRDDTIFIEVILDQEYQESAAP
ncbi:TNF receptor-associated factor 1 [Anopheles ziemanni]|uniref:TNF receptor-associated factor 1 n=1 Tax=Anopheles coustani TaxID=139045 RepID=UPI00265A8CCF|nr:TNF receptor-associated factor 1 [Anopheles coustani]XP_058175800.1 TNF receptor-associated factor 1 [Anopheles ziemanni]